MSVSDFVIHTLGCKLNYAESCTIARQLTDLGWKEKTFPESADVYILNTCSVTDNADKECAKIIRQLHKKYPASFIIVTGCFAQLNPKAIARMEGVDLILGANEKFNLITHITSLQKEQTHIHSCSIESVSDFKSAFSYQSRTRAFLKIQDGCDYSCSYCTIPKARGKSRSDTTANILRQAEFLAAQGIKEIVLTGVNIGDFGTKNGQTQKGGFLKLLQSLDRLPSLQRIRISSIEPNLLDTDIIDFVKNSRLFMPHFHIPLQSGSDTILRLMQRRYLRHLYQERVQYIKKQIPHCAIGVDIIVGFPGENEKEFQETFKFLHGLDVSYFHVFTYSERENTKAITLPDKVPLSIKKERNKILRALSYHKSQYFKNLFLGTQRPVLFESPTKKNTIEGYTDNYIKIETGYKAELLNTIREWTIF